MEWLLGKAKNEEMRFRLNFLDGCAAGCKLAYNPISEGAIMGFVKMTFVWLLVASSLRQAQSAKSAKGRAPTLPLRPIAERNPVACLPTGRNQCLRSLFEVPDVVAHYCQR